jgi:hypothetical protein
MSIPTSKIITVIADNDYIPVIQSSGGDAQAYISGTNLQDYIIESLDETKLVTTDGTQTLTNKTATGLKIGVTGGTKYCKIQSTTQTGDVLLTIPNAGDTADEFVLKDTAQTLTLKTLVFPDVPVVNAVAANKVLTVADVPHEGDTVTIGAKTYKARLTALGAGVAATAILTSNNTECTDGINVVVNNRTYRLITTMTQAYDVKRDGTTADTTLANLVHAVNGTGAAGVNYYAGTLTPTNVTAGAVTSHAITFTASAVGFAGNAYPKSTTEATTLDWDGVGAYFTGGIDAQAANDVFVNSTAEAFIVNLEKAVEATGSAGTDYGTGTTVNATVLISAKNSSTATATAITKGVAGNSIAIAVGGASPSGHLTWAGSATALSGGVDGTVGATGQMQLDIAGSKIWFCTLPNTIADANWKYASLT